MRRIRPDRALTDAERSARHRLRAGAALALAERLAAEDADISTLAQARAAARAALRQGDER